MSRPKNIIETRRQTEELLRGRRDFRYNTVMHQVEWRPRGGGPFAPMEDFHLNTIQRELELDGMLVGTDRLDRILRSDMVPRVNPVAEYLGGLAHGGADRIGELARTVEADDPERFRDHLTKWLVAAVANALTPEGCQNHTCLVLAGPQGAHKTTWLNLLCPPELSGYLYCGRIHPDNKDTLHHLAQCLLVNVDDQLRNLNRNDENALKGLITLPEVKFRLPYGRYVQAMPRMASFMGSVNGGDFLTDPTGSRRFLPFEVRGIDIRAARRLDVGKVWAQAVHYWRGGFRYWFDEGEVAGLKEGNEAFRVHSEEHELLADHFQPAPRAAAALHLTSTAIKVEIERATGQRLSPKRLGEALREQGFERWQRRSGGGRPWVWAVDRAEGGAE